MKTRNLEHFAAHHAGLRIRNHVDGNGGQEKEQQVPGCCNARAWPPGGNKRHAAERHGASCTGHRQGNACINTSAATVRAKALGSPLIKPPLAVTGECRNARVAEITVKLLLLLLSCYCYYNDYSRDITCLTCWCVAAEANAKLLSGDTPTHFRVLSILCTHKRLVLLRFWRFTSYFFTFSCLHIPYTPTQSEMISAIYARSCCCTNLLVICKHIVEKLWVNKEPRWDLKNAQKHICTLAQIFHVDQNLIFLFEFFHLLIIINS